MTNEEINDYKNFLIGHFVQEFKDKEITLNEIEDEQVLGYCIEVYTKEYIETLNLSEADIWHFAYVDENWDELAKEIDGAIRATIREKWDKYLKGEN